MGKKIDVIIPAYNVPDEILFRCLASIAIQDILKDIEVTIVDDASTKQNYTKVIEPFLPIMKVQILRYEVNGGPGVARQYGIDHTHNEYISFIDSDDAFNGSWALETLRNGIESDDNRYQMCVGVFDEIINSDYVGTDNTPAIVEYSNNMVWVFAKIYRRDFLQRYNIRFHPTSRANEDTGFNAMCNLLLQDDKLIKFIPDHIYLWLDNPNSITRTGNHKYAFGSSERDNLYGYVENMTYAYKTIKKIKPNAKGYLSFVIYSVTWLYEHYVQCYVMNPDAFSENLKWYNRYYKEIFQYYENEVTIDLIENFYDSKMNDFFEEINIVPHKDFMEFIEEIKLVK